MWLKIKMKNTGEVKKRMFSHIVQWKNSNQSQKAYCIEHNIRYYVFHYWFKRYRNEDDGKKNSSPLFIKIQPEQLKATVHAELILPNGNRLVFYEPAGSDFLKALIS